jgi:hypothetical protein
LFGAQPIRVYLLFEEGKVFLLLQGNFFLAVECYIFLFPLFPIIFTGKLLEDFWLATGASGRVARKFGR